MPNSPDCGRSAERSREIDRGRRWSERNRFSRNGRVSHDLRASVCGGPGRDGRVNDIVRFTIRWARTCRGIPILAIVGSCSPTYPPATSTVADGCYEPAVGPYSLAPGDALGQRFKPAWIKLDSTAAKVPGGGFVVGIPDGFHFPIETRGVWDRLGKDSLLIEWGSQHAGPTFRLSVEDGGLRGTGHFPMTDSVWPVFAERIECGQQGNSRPRNRHR